MRRELGQQFGRKGNARRSPVGELTHKCGSLDDRKRARRMLPGEVAHLGDIVTIDRTVTFLGGGPPAKTTVSPEGPVKTSEAPARISGESPRQERAI